MPRSAPTKTNLAKIAAASVVVVAAVAFLIGPKPDKPVTSPEAVAASGAVTVDVADPVHDRPFEVSAWAPGANDNDTLVVISHGFSGDRTSHDDLATALAAEGYTVAAPTHPDLAGLESTNDQLDPLVLRPRHLSLTIDHMTAAQTDTGASFDRVIVVGHSLGGYSALRLAGATPSATGLEAHCTSQPADQVLCSSAARDRIAVVVSNPADVTDDRIDAVALLAPAYGPLFSTRDFESVTAEVLVVGAKTDTELPGGQVEALVTALPSGTESITVDGGHYVFLRTCTDAERQTQPELCVDDSSVNRSVVHTDVLTEIEAVVGRLLAEL